ncbi:MAG: hypothetical protein COX80_04340 [Candidatus Magasanikbacteria bacterium CG_4_10_14_0_2_um_filter_33_14]|uniref:Nudix hydrolase domain-containing protein n=1 Tax=Candidatus Magasanikbacteria bacterium CG_4_10_14_0_2_um_filter_33_14 TaxID=1974636 RepID=A0A2M7V9G2_9BACT|nr:MAG: hypothetical protein COX80_04340 [Candidatus Magasanikbacteria bacterium CG_4_10_14_0_2_um_filter_33_14]
MIPWKKIKEESLRTGYRKLLKKTFELPDGKTAEFDIKHEGPAVCILAITKNNKVVLTKQFRPGPEKILLEMPGGGVDQYESSLEAAKRELLEETGYTGDFEFVGTCLECAYSTMIRYNFIAKNCEKVQKQELDAYEFIEVVEMSLDDFRKHLKTGELTDVDSGYLCLDSLNML